MSSYDRQGFTARGGWWVAAQMPLLLAVALLPPWTADPALPQAMRWVGGGVLVGGLLIGAAAAHALGRSLTPFPHPREDGEFCERGVYRHARHPMYTSVLLVTLGWVLLWQSLASLALLPVLFVFFDRKARHEEHWLAQKYSAYAAYRARVKKFFPGLY